MALYKPREGHIITTTTTTHEGFTSRLEVERAIVEWEAREGGAWAYTAVYDTAYVTRAASPSKLPDHLCSDWGGNQKVYWKGAWQAFSDAVRIREQNRGLLAD